MGMVGRESMGTTGHELNWPVGGVGTGESVDPSVTGFNSGGVGGPPSAPMQGGVNPNAQPSQTVEGQYRRMAAEQAARIPAAKKAQAEVAKRDTRQMRGLSSATIVNDPLNKLHFSEQAINNATGFINATKFGSDEDVSQRQSILKDPFNVVHYGQAAVDKARSDSARSAQNIETINSLPEVTGAGTLKRKPQ